MICGFSFEEAQNMPIQEAQVRVKSWAELKGG